MPTINSFKLRCDAWQRKPRTVRWTEARWIRSARVAQAQAACRSALKALAKLHQAREQTRQAEAEETG
jgi:hypothetical protein